MTKERRQQVLLAALVAVLLVVGGRLMVRSFAGAGDPGAVATGRGLSGTGEFVDRVEELRVADLELAPETFKIGRDPFRFRVPRRQPQPKPKPPPVRNPRPAPVQTAPPRQAPVTPQPPPVDVVYLGRFGSTSRPIAVFSDGREIFNVFEGGVLKGNFVVDKIGYESADLKFVGFPDTPSKRLAVGG